MKLATYISLLFSLSFFACGTDGGGDNPNANLPDAGGSSGCLADQHVVDNACEPCPAGSTNPAGDDVWQGDTDCNFPATTFARTTSAHQTDVVQTYIIPEGVRLVHIDATGAAGGRTNERDGGLGTQAKCNAPVWPGQQLHVVIGEEGGPGFYAGGGGGASAVWLSNETEPLCVGGGGGGAVRTAVGLDASGTSASGHGGNWGSNGNAGGGGGGFLTGGGTFSTLYGSGGEALSTSSAFGGDSGGPNGGTGGFGGGGGAGAAVDAGGGEIRGGGGGGGGGGEGGDGGNQGDPGSGGTSFLSGLNPVINLRIGTGNGSVIITPM